MKNKHILFIVEISILVFAAILLAGRARFSHSFTKEELINCRWMNFFQYVDIDDVENILTVSADNKIGLGYENRQFASEQIAYWDISVPFGLYTLSVEYQSDYEDISENQQIYIEAFAGEHDDKFRVEPISLKKDAMRAETMFWKIPCANLGEYGFNIFLKAVEGETTIQSIKIEEYSLWRIGAWLLLLFFMTLFNLCIFVLPKCTTNQKLIFMWLTVLVAFTSLPAINSELYDGHDVGFHMSRIMTMVNELKYGNFPVRFQHDVYNGCGSIAHIMYPNLFLYIPAFLHILGMPLDISYNIYIILVNILTCVLCYYSFVKLFYKRTYALIGTTVYMLAAYRICNIYVRFAVGEYTAMAFEPLVIYGIIKLYYYKENKRIVDCVPLIIGISGMIQSHILSCEIMSAFLVLWALLHFRKTINVLKKLLISIVFVVGINAFFLLPFVEMYCTDLMIKGNNPKSPVGHGIYLTQILGIFQTWGGGSVSNSAVGEMPLILGPSMLIGILMFLVCFIKRKDWQLRQEEDFRIYGILFGFGILALWIASAYFPWSYLDNSTSLLAKLFVAIEFPWRYLAFADLFLTFSLVYTITTLSKKGFWKWREVQVEALVILVAFLVIGDFYRDYINNHPTENVDYVMTDYTVDNMYNLKTFVEIDVPEFTKQMVEAHSEVEFHDIECVKDKKYYSLTNGKEEVLISFPIQAYKYVYAKDKNTGWNLATEPDAYGKLSVIIPANYSGTIEIGFQEPVLWRIAEGVSAVFIIGILIFMGCYYKYLGVNKLNGKQEKLVAE